MAALNLSDFTTVINDDFTKDRSLDTSIWSAHWGNPNQYWFTGGKAGLLISGSQDANWNAVGIEQAPTGKSAGEGYGLYSFTGYAGQAGQGVGIALLLWPSDNVWLPSSKPGQASEIDILESWDGTKNGYSTIHFYQPGSDNNGQSIHQIKFDPTVQHTYALDWEGGSLTYYVDGQEIYQDTTHVPLDFAHGGVNETMGAEVVNEASYQTTPTVQLYIQDISYATRNVTAAAPPPAPATITLSAPGTAQEAVAGAGVTVTETVAGTGLSTVYVEVLTAGGIVESGYQAIVLNASGAGNFEIHLAAGGDYIQAVDSLTVTTVTARSSAVTITDPVVVTPPAPKTILLSAPGTLQEASLSSGATVTELFSSIGLSSLYAEVLTSTGTIESGYQQVILDASGNGSLRIHLAQSGDYINATDSMTTPTVTSRSAAVTITTPDPPPPVSPVVTVAEPASLVVGIHSFAGSVTGSPGSVELAWHTTGTEVNGASDFVHATVAADGTFTVELDVDHPGVSSTLWADVDGKVTRLWSMAPIAAAVIPPPVPPVTPPGILTITGVSEDAGRLLVSGVKSAGAPQTMREFLDGKYLGVVRDHFADGSYFLHLADTTNGSHRLEFTLDGSGASAVYDFTKSSGVVVHTPTAVLQDAAGSGGVASAIAGIAAANAATAILMSDVL